MGYIYPLKMRQMLRTRSRYVPLHSFLEGAVVSTGAGDEEVKGRVTD
jgi:hypothetical protein